MYSQFFTKDEDGKDSYYDATSLLHYTYDMQTPWKAIFSIATVLGQKAIISLDYELNNYKSAKFSDNDGNYDYTAINQDIDAYLTNTHNVRFGAEYRANSLFSLRAGYAYWASPYRHSNAGKIQSISGGFGLNFGSFYCDAAYVYQHASDSTLFYQYIDPEDSRYDVISEPVKNKYNTHEIKFTLGFRF
jgi:long-subunit fatty acid transport protein